MHQLWLIPALPLAGFLVNGLFGRKLPKSAVNAAAIGSVILSFLWVVKTLLALGPLETPYVERYFTWIQSGLVHVGFDLSIDRLTAVMLLIVTGIGGLIHIYAAGYMAHEGGYYRFFAYLNLFMFFMLVLVMAANFLLLFVGWEGVGLCSYLLIGFYFLKKSAGDAGKKAFVVNRIGDFGFSLAMFLIMAGFGSLDFQAVFAQVGVAGHGVAPATITLICLLLLLGAAGKSAQVPLYVWLPDAMEGPTPVSALIHAATMVTAGVYMIARAAPLFNQSPAALEVVSYVGLITAVLAATIGLTQYDIKKVFAYSTVSQLGYMFLALGSGAYAAGIFHVMTHAFFKALLFLGAGSVIHALQGEQDLRLMGGLRRKIPVTFAVLMCAAVAIAGVPPFSGYHSKDAILLAAHAHHPWMYWVGVATAGMTAFYVFRAIFLCFFGSYRGTAHAHESPLVMTGPLMVLAALSLGGGYLDVPEYLAPIFGAAHGEHDQALVAISVAAGVAGIAIAWLFYIVSPGLPDGLARIFSGPYKLLYNKYFVDEAYDAVIVHPIRDGSTAVLWKGVDAGFIDGAVNGVGSVARALGGALRNLQSGYIRRYAAWVVLGCVVLVAVAGFWGGVK
ncbi:MAG: NADH-quinone oxidoreductase subunit L [Candidatus Solibacter usitatus]|nr:NADH-quinone oxidoreductase subunit L [Candidatus Solibacter usitatus]